MIHRNAFAVTAGSIGALLGIGLLVWSYCLGIATAPSAEWEGYFEKPNWSLYPIFFVVVAGCCIAISEIYVSAWRDLIAGGKSVIFTDQVKVTDQSFLEPLIALLLKLGRRSSYCALAIGLLLAAIDFSCLWREFEIFGWPRGCREHGFSYAFQHVEMFPGSQITYASNLAFDAVAFSMEGLLVAIALQSLAQICLHSAYLMFFEHCEFARVRRARIILDHKDPIGEFGVSSFNNAINVSYALIAIGMFVPCVSAFKNSKPPFDIGQYLQMILLPLILLAPAIFPIAERVRRIADVRRHIATMGRTEEYSDYDKQKLWPWDQRFIGAIGKVSILVILAEYSYVAFQSPELLIELIKKIL
jgi:hypothetical protein